MRKLIKRFIDWLNEPQPTIGCPDPVMHDIHSESQHVEVLAAAIK